MSARSMACSRALLIVWPFLLSPAALAGGFDVPVISTSLQGTSNASSAEANDPSVIYYNPAGLTRLRGTQVSNSLGILTLRGTVENQGTHGTPPPNNLDNAETSNPGAPTVGGNGGSYWPRLFGTASLFASTPYNDQITLGFGLFPAAGGSLNYKKDWFGRNFADSTAVEIINANSVAAIRFDDKHSIGIGGSVLVGHLKQKLQIDIPGVAPYLLQPVIDDVGAGSVGSLVNNLLGISVIPPSLTNALNALGLNGATLLSAIPAQQKGQLAELLGGILLTDDSNGSGTIEMFGYGLGWNVGYMFQFDDKTRLGIAFRSHTKIKMRGDLDWDVEDVHGITDNLPGVNGLPAPDGTGNVSASDLLSKYYRPDATTKSEIIIPARLSIGFFRELTDKIDLMLDYTFIRSSDVRQIKIDILDEKDPSGNTISQQPGYLIANWKNSFKASIGMNYHYSDKLTLRTGFQYDKTPIPSPEDRHPGAPDSDRYMYSIGANYMLRKHTSIDLAYSYIMLADASARYRDPCRGVYLEGDDGFTADKPQDCTGNGGTFKGRFSDTVIQVLGLQLNQRF